MIFLCKALKTPPDSLLLYKRVPYRSCRCDNIVVQRHQGWSKRICYASNLYIYIYMNNTTASAAPTKLCLYYLAKLAGLQHEAIAKKCMKGLYTLQMSCGSLCLNHLVDDYFAALASLPITSVLLKRQGK